MSKKNEQTLEELNSKSLAYALEQIQIVEERRSDRSRFIKNSSPDENVPYTFERESESQDADQSTQSISTADGSTS